MVKVLLNLYKVTCVSGLLSVRKIYVNLSHLVEVYLTYNLHKLGAGN